MAQNLSHALDPNEKLPWQSGPQERGGLSIVWSCLAVILTCTWNTLHLTVPRVHWPSEPMNAYALRIVIRKLKWMAVMVIFPEFVFAHAVLELKLALDDLLRLDESRDKLYRETFWKIRVGKRARLVHELLTGQKFRWPIIRVRNEDATIPTETHANLNLGEIEAEDADRSWTSPDLGSHRVYQAKTLTLTHCYLANIGGIVVFYKKQEDDGGIPTLTGSRIMTGNYLAETLTSPTPEERLTMRAIRMSEEDISDKSKADSFVRVLWLWEILRLVVEIITRAVRAYPITQLEIVTVSFAALSLTTVLVQAKKPKDINRALQFRVDNDPWNIREIKCTPNLASISQTFFNILKRQTFSGFHDTDEALPDLDHRVPNDYYRPTKENEMLFFTMLSFSTVLFGSVHCGAWNFDFPTLVEKWLWRCCALASIAMPFLLLSMSILLQGRHRKLAANYKYSKDEFESAWTNLERVSRQHREGISVIRLMKGSTTQHANKLVREVNGFYEHEPMPDEVITASADLTAAAALCERNHLESTKWARIGKLAQIPGLIIYLLTRFAILGVALACLRSAPRGIYWATWADFLPAMK